jgi:penicillin-binding protein-related factor A (putative recombinase)
MSNTGKDFEQDFKIASKAEGIFIERFYDVTLGKATISYPCDFFIYDEGRLFYLELKSTKTGTVPLKNISKNQYDGLTERSKYKGVVAGFLIKYAKYGEHFFIPISEIRKLKKSGKKSIMYKDVKRGTIKAVPMTGILKRTRYGYKVKEHIDLLAETYKVV